VLQGIDAIDAAPTLLLDPVEGLQAALAAAQSGVSDLQASATSINTDGDDVEVRYFPLFDAVQFYQL
jgi:hypothetical protein